jgi:EpsG-like putative glucosyltransferase
LFIFWPFLAFLLALANYNTKEARKVVFFFLIYYGLTFVNNNESGDAYRYILNLQINGSLPFSEIFKLLGGLYASTSIDIVEPLVSFIISRFTVYHGVYFAVWAAIFGYFYLKSINLIHDRYQLNPGWNTMIPMAFIVLVLPITNISGVRMWTAAWIFFYGAYQVIINRDKRFIFLALAASLLHWSFLSANAVLLIYFFVGNRNYIYTPLAAISFLAPTLLLPTFSALSYKLGGAFLVRFEGYSSEGYIMNQQLMHQSASWFLKLGYDLVFYYFLLAIIIIQFNSLYVEKDDKMKNLYSFLLLFLAFVNFGKAIPSFGGRFQILFLIFASLYLFLYHARIKTDKITVLTLLGIFPMLLNVAISFRLASQSISVWLFTPGLGLPLLAPGISLFDLLFK